MERNQKVKKKIKELKKKINREELNFETTKTLFFFFGNDKQQYFIPFQLLFICGGKKLSIAH